MGWVPTSTLHTTVEEVNVTVWTRSRSDLIYCSKCIRKVSTKKSKLDAPVAPLAPQALPMVSKPPTEGAGDVLFSLGVSLGFSSLGLSSLFFASALALLGLAMASLGVSAGAGGAVEVGAGGGLLEVYIGTMIGHYSVPTIIIETITLGLGLQRFLDPSARRVNSLAASLRAMLRPWWALEIREMPRRWLELASAAPTARTRRVKRAEVFIVKD